MREVWDICRDWWGRMQDLLMRDSLSCKATCVQLSLQNRSQAKVASPLMLDMCKRDAMETYTSTGQGFVRHGLRPLRVEYRLHQTVHSALCCYARTLMQVIHLTSSGLDLPSWCVTEAASQLMSNWDYWYIPIRITNWLCTNEGNHLWKQKAEPKKSAQVLAIEVQLI